MSFEKIENVIKINNNFEEEKEYLDFTKDSIVFDIHYIFNINLKNLEFYKFDFTKMANFDFYYYVASFFYEKNKIILFLFYDSEKLVENDSFISKFKIFIKNYFKNYEKFEKNVVFSDEIENTQLKEKLEKISNFIEKYYTPLEYDYNIIF